MLKELLYDYKVPSDKKVTDFDVKVSNIQVVRDFIQSWHYSKSVNGLRISHVFGLYCDNELGSGWIGLYLDRFGLDLYCIWIGLGMNFDWI